VKKTWAGFVLRAGFVPYWNIKRNENYIKSLGFDAANSEMEEEKHLRTKKEMGVSTTGNAEVV
jgi:hypothetical protein